ncbi:DUF6041 domain-containing protein [Stomatohabitans albus]|uniref:DUF6041 domain-containing protein n=1 Tax=Stomatohabitans albus TaxID=3110766 RepID=UPI00300D9A1C
MRNRTVESRSTLRARRVLGACYLAAGIGKCFPSWESTEGRLTQALEANRGTVIEQPTQWLLREHEGVNAFVASAMTGAGVAIVAGEGPIVDTAIACTLPMLGCFVTVLHRALPAVIPVDLAFAGAAIWILRKRRQSRCVS